MPLTAGLAVQPSLVAHVAHVAQLWQSPVSFQLCSSLPKPPRLGETLTRATLQMGLLGGFITVAMTFVKCFKKPKSRILPLPPPPLSPTPPPPTTRMFIWQVARATVLRVEVLVITSFDTYFFEFLFAFCLLVCLLFMLILFPFLFFSFCFAGNA